MIKPLTEKMYKVQFTANEALHAKLRQTQELMRHSIPDGDLSQLFEQALDALLENKMRQRFGRRSLKPTRSASATEVPACQPRAPAEDARPAEPATLDAGAPRSRHIPRHVQRTVWERDDGRCTFVSAEGRRCDARGFLEFHHHESFGRGGPHPHRVENISVMCTNHNQFLAEQEYGVAFMEQRRKGGAS